MIEAGLNSCGSPGGQNNCPDVKNRLARGLIKKSLIIVPRKTPCSTMVEIKSALVPLRVCSVALGVSEIQIMSMVEEGKLRWVWDMRRSSARRAFVLVLAQSILYAQTGRAGPDLPLSDEEGWEKVLGIVLPHQKPLIKGSELVRAFSISSQHMMNLVNDGALVALNARRLRTSTPIITRESVVKFLKERRIG